MTKDDQPLVSIIIPLFDAQLFIAQTLQSARDQTYKTLEIIVVDDGSTDGSGAIVRAVDDPRLTYIRQDNAGVSAARNTGLKAARGEIIAFLDSDDLWEPTKIARHVDHLMSDPHIGVSFSACRFIDEHGARMQAGYRPKMTDITVADLYRRNPIAGGSAGVFRRAVFDTIVEPASGDGITEWFDRNASPDGGSYAEDHQCWLRMALHSALRFEGIDEVLHYYRIHNGGLSAKIDKMDRGWQGIDAYVAKHAPKVHREHGRSANAYQMRYFARRLVAMGEGRRALGYVRRSLGFSLAPIYQEPRKTLSTLAAAIALVVAPGFVARLITQSKPKLENPL